MMVSSSWADLTPKVIDKTTAAPGRAAVRFRALHREHTRLAGEKAGETFVPRARRRPRAAAPSSPAMAGSRARPLLRQHHCEGSHRRCGKSQFHHVERETREIGSTTDQQRSEQFRLVIAKVVASRWSTWGAFAGSASAA